MKKELMDKKERIVGLAKIVMAHDKSGDVVLRDQVLRDFMNLVAYYPQRRQISTAEYRGQVVEVRYYTPRSSTRDKWVAVERWAEEEAN